MASILETGTVVKPVRNASTNASTTTEPTSGVVRDVRELPGTFDLSPAGVFDSSADQYRAAFLLSGATSEYLVFAANTSNFATVDADEWAVSDADATVPTGTLPVLDTNSTTGQRSDGSPRLVVKDRAGRTISRYLTVTVVRGDDGTETGVVLTSGVDFTGTPEGNYLTVIDNATTQSLLTPVGGGAPGFSALRGDRVTSVSYVVEEAKFWWSRNDTGSLPRFGWDGREQKWAPLTGGSVVDLGALSSTHAPVLNPLPANLEEGGWLPGILDNDAWCMLRVGTAPDATSYALSKDIDDTGAPFDGVHVVSDAEAASPYTFTGSPEPAGVIGITSGLIQWNPDFVAAYAGKHIWYSLEQFDRGGLVGDVLGSDSSPLFLAPAPTPVEFPLLRLGLRQWLTVNVVDTEAELLALSAPAEGTAAVARSTGRVRLSQTDIDKTDPTSGSFDASWMGTQLFYDGVVLTSTPQTLRAPSSVLGSKGGSALVQVGVDLYVDNASLLPGLGVSGILSVPDGTGATPTTGDPAVRPGGDDPADPYTGLVRQVESLGDTFVFTQSGPLQLEVVDWVSDLPDARSIPSGTAYLTREVSAFGSVLRLAHADSLAREDEEIYFIQCDLTPSRYQPLAQAVSRRTEPFIFTGETFHFSIDGINYQWDSSALGVDIPFSARQVALSIDAIISGSGSCRYQRGHVIIEADDPTTGVVEIGFGTTTRDLTAASELGFTPGWRVDTAQTATHWQQDSGISLGMFRSGSNLDGSRDIADSVARGRLGGQILQSPVLATACVLLNRPPLRDVAGYDYDVFFSGDAVGQLDPRTDLEYKFESTPPQVCWLDTVTSVTPITSGGSTVSLGATGLVPASFDEDGQGVFLAEDGDNFVEQTYGTDFVLADPGGSTGAIRFIETYGAEVLAGGRGSYSSGSDLFTDPDTTFIGNVEFGNQLVLQSGPNAGSSYIIRAISLNSIAVDPDFLENSGSDPVSWVVLDGERDNTYDPTLLADVVYLPFHHLEGREPFEIDLLSALGTTPVDVADQISNRLVAFVEDSVESGRSTYIRFGRTRRQGEATLTALQKSTLGTLANGSLFVPGTASDRFASESFSIRIANTEFTHGVDLTAVVSFTSPIPSGQVEYLTSTGELGFASDLLSDYEGANVGYQEEFSLASDLAEGVAEFDPTTGEINLSSADLAVNQGEEVYYRERMILENRLDVVVSPLNGSFAFNKVLRSGQIVEVAYYQADSGGNQVLANGFPQQIVEQLPIKVRREQAARRNAQTYFFNFQGRTIDERTEIVVYVDQVRQNYGTAQTVYVDVEQNLIRFLGVEIGITQSVQISYSCFETSGGEKTYRVSSGPVYRPAFLLQAGENEFSLSGDRSDIERGMLLRLGSTALYIEDSVYDAGSDATLITTYPTLDYNLGSTSPGNDILSLITSTPVTTVVNGNSSPTAPAGFRSTIANEYLTVRRLSNFIDIRGDATQFAVPGHLLEIGTHPYIITGAETVNEGRLTRVFVAQPFYKEYAYGTDTLRMSVRPIYPNGARQILGINPMLSTQDFSLVLFGEVDSDGNELPGRELTLSSEYALDSSSGSVFLLEPNQAGFGPNQKLFLRYTKLRNLGPKVVDGVIQIPRVLAKFAHTSVPTAESGRLGDTLRVDYDYRSPDSFYLQVDSFANLLSDVVSEVEAAVVSQTGSGGGLTGVRDDVVLSEQGYLGVLGQARNLLDKDRAARASASFYHRIVDGFDQVSEAISGEPIGDRDGRFGMYLGEPSEYPQPGAEDDVTGYVNARQVWSEVSLKETADRSYPLIHLETDPLVDPATATLASGVLTGDSVGSRLPALLNAQERLILSHVDDRVLLPSGQFASLSEPNVSSRLFSLAATAFATTVAGLGTSPGEYGAAVQVENPDGSTSTLSTYLTSIAQLENPARGALTNVLSASVRRRLPRARIVSVEETGVESLDATTADRVTLIASIVGPVFFPMDAAGLPETTLLQSQSADPDAVVDIETGDETLDLPPFESYVDAEGSSFLQVSLLKSSGEVYEIRTSSTTMSENGREVPSYVYVDTVSSGCLITLQDLLGNAITSLSQLQRVLYGGRVETLSIEAGDVLVGVPANISWFTPSDPYTQADIAFLASSLPYFRLGYDVEIDRSGGLLLDITQADPSQNAPGPLETLESSVSLSSFDGTSPLALPALSGQPLTDDGDAYHPSAEGELEALRGLTSALSILDVDSAEPGAAYPYELAIRDGVVQTTFSGGILPGSLKTTTNLLPVTTGGFTSGSGDADLQPYDVVMVRLDEYDYFVESGLQGIFSVGDVFQSGGNSYIDLPKWVTQSRRGDRIRYNLQGAMNSFSGSGTVGITVEESGGNTIFDISTMSLVFNDGSAGTTGGLNHILDNTLLPYPNENEIVIRIYNTAGTALLETITITGDPTGALGPVGGLSQGGLGQASHTQPVIGQKTITVPTTGFVNMAVLGGGPGPVGPFNFRLSVFTSPVGGIRASASTTYRGSDTAQIGSDRLTFTERIDLSTALPHGYQYGIFILNTTLNIDTVTGPYSENIEVNSIGEVDNDQVHFLDRDGSGFAGSFVNASGGGAGDELGTLRAPGFMAWGTQPPPIITQVHMQAIPSTSYDVDGVILSGEGLCDGGSAVYENRITEIVASSGAVSNVQAGDIVAITSAADGGAPTYPGALATTKSGTYLVRQVVVADATGYRGDTFTTNAGDYGGWLQSALPKVVVSSSESGTTLTVSNLYPIADSPTGHSFPSSGRVYVLVDVADLESSTPSVFATALVSAAYTSVDSATRTFQGLSTFYDASGSAITSADFFAAASVGRSVSGMQYLGVQISDPDLPTDNLVGYDTASSPNGLRYFELGSSVSTASATEIQFDGSASEIVDLAGAASGKIVFVQRPKEASSSFVSDPTLPVYDHVPGYLDLTQITKAQWDSLNRESTIVSSEVSCLLPGMELAARGPAAEDGFWTQSGIFLEPSWPLTVNDIGQSPVKVISKSFSGTEIGMRQASSFNTGVTPEPVAFEVRRTRRFSQQMRDTSRFTDSLHALYHPISEGQIFSYAALDNQSALVTISLNSSTPFDEVEAGDMLVVREASGVLFGKCLVQGVRSETQLVLRPPGIPGAQGKYYEVYRRRASVPIVQSAEQLLEAVAEEVFRGTDGEVTNTGTYSDSINILRDAGVAFATEDIAVGDYLVVDPAGFLGVGPTNDEYGAPPQGDISTSARGNFVAGSPSTLDDNRGFYRIVEINPTNVVVTGSHAFAGDLDSGDVILGGTVSKRYVVYPTVTASGLSGGVEGQNDLRPTSPQVFFGGFYTHATNYLSIEPFEYRIVRPFERVSQEVMELVLHIRERALSFAQTLDENAKTVGTYFRFQEEQHLYDLNTGALQKTQVALLKGEDGVTPFSSSSRGLSLLDRRFWTKDPSLNRLPSGGPYYADFPGGDGLPVLVDYIDRAVSTNDAYREIRQAWLEFRTDLVSGTLAALRRSESLSDLQNTLKERLMKLLKGIS